MQIDNEDAYLLILKSDYKDYVDSIQKDNPGCGVLDFESWLENKFRKAAGMREVVFPCGVPADPKEAK